MPTRPGAACRSITSRQAQPYEVNPRRHRYRRDLSPLRADAAWCSLSIHHLSTQDKLSLMKAIRGAIGTGGIFLLYEPTRRAGEDRAAWLDRFVRTNKPLWRVLTPPEWDQIWHHVATCDFPETAAVWCEIGREAGFGEARQVFVDPTDFFQLFRFEA